MPFFGKNRERLQARARKIKRLEAELATYRHAFETTAVDRDRLRGLLGEAQASAPAAEPTPATQTAVTPTAGANSANVGAYGPLWGRVADDYEMFADNAPVDQEVFESILRYGGFSQFTMYTDRAFLGRLIDWQIGALAGIGASLENFPAAYHETNAMPAHLRLERAGRPVSADFLRLLAYTHMIGGQLIEAGARPPRLIVEIGSGYGGLARLLKLRYPKSTICLIDLPVCLRAAEPPTLAAGYLRGLGG